MCVKFYMSFINISGVTDINVTREKYGCHTVNTWDIDWIICVHMHSAYIYMPVKFKVSITNISGGI